MTNAIGEPFGGQTDGKRFEMLPAQYETKRSELEPSVSVLQSEIDGFNGDSDRAGKFIELVKRHTDFSELTPAMIHEYTEKIIVYEPDRSSCLPIVPFSCVSNPDKSVI